MTDATETCPFKIGDLVRVTRRNVEWEGWMPSMDSYVGAVGTIMDIAFQDGRGYADIDGWYFPVEVLEKVDNPRIGSSAMIDFDVKDRWSGEVMFTAPIAAEEDTPLGVKIGLAVKWALDAKKPLAGAKLAGAKLAGAKLAGVNLTDANLAGADLTGADLTDADLTGADLTDADLTGADLDGANFAGADLTGASW